MDIFRFAAISLYFLRSRLLRINTNTVVATTLVEGSVELSSDTGNGAKVILEPSEQARFDAKSNAFSREVVDTAIYTAWIQDKLIINNLSFAEILRRLERMHDVEIINKAPDLNKEMFKGEFAGEDIKNDSHNHGHERTL